MAPKQDATARIEAFIKQDKANKACAVCGGYVTTVLVLHSSFVCSRCSGVLSNFGLSVKGVKMTSWKDADADRICNGGNVREREELCGKWNGADLAVTADSEDKEVRNFIEAKYVEKRWLGPPKPPPPPPPPPPAPADTAAPKEQAKSPKSKKEKKDRERSSSRRAEKKEKAESKHAAQTGGFDASFDASFDAGWAGPQATGPAQSTYGSYPPQEVGQMSGGFGFGGGCGAAPGDFGCGGGAFGAAPADSWTGAQGGYGCGAPPQASWTGAQGGYGAPPPQMQVPVDPTNPFVAMAAQAGLQPAMLVEQYRRQQEQQRQAKAQKLQELQQRRQQLLQLIQQQQEPGLAAQPYGMAGSWGASPMPQPCSGAIVNPFM